MQEGLLKKHPSMFSDSKELVFILLDVLKTTVQTRHSTHRETQSGYFLDSQSLFFDFIFIFILIFVFIWWRYSRPKIQCIFRSLLQTFQYNAAVLIIKAIRGTYKKKLFNELGLYRKVSCLQKIDITVS